MAKIKRPLGAGVVLALATLATGCAVTPRPYEASDQKQIAAADRLKAQADVPPLTAPLTLPEALARALKYNLDHRTRLMEQALAVGQLDLSKYDLLPKLTAAAGYNWRSNERITRSVDSVTGLPSLANPYISSDRAHFTQDLGLTWNILDFGVSYQNSKQNADRVLVASERRRKAMHLLMQDVRTAYWRAASAQQLEASLTETIRTAEAAMVDSRRVESEQIRDPIEPLRYQRSLLENLRVLESVQLELSAAQTELAALINVPVGTKIRLAEPQEADLTPKDFGLPVERMEEIAIANNADLKEQFYGARIAAAETRKSLLKLFPGITLSYSFRHDDDSYLINNDWQEAGTQIGINLFNLLSAPAMMRFSRANEELAQQRRMAAQMAVLAQVHLSLQQYRSARTLFARADAIWKVDRRIDEHSANREAAAVRSQLDRVSNNTSAIVSLLRRYQALNQVYAARSKIQSTLGVEPQIGSLQEISLEDLIKAIEAADREG